MRATTMSAMMAAGLAAALATAAAAQPGPPPGGGMMLPATRAEAVTQARHEFALLDRNHDGAITRDEIPTRATTPPPPDRAARDRAFAALDRNGDGRIDRDEFEAFDPGAMRGPPGAVLHGGARMAAMLFDRADTDRDGRVTPAEAERLALAGFDLADTNHDGKLSDAERAAAGRMMRR